MPRRAFTARVCIGLPLLMLFAGSAYAGGLERFQGAWGSQGIPCDTIFQNKDGRVAFNLIYGARVDGFIVNGKNIDGAHAACKVMSDSEQGDQYKFVVGCREDIIFDKLVVAVKFLNDDTLVRYDTDFPEIESTYVRCKL
jgi:hypothetical protein